MGHFTKQIISFLVDTQSKIAEDDLQHKMLHITAKIQEIRPLSLISQSIDRLLSYSGQSPLL